jgi:hypothetical protein
VNTSLKYAAGISSVAIILKLIIFLTGNNFTALDDYYIHAVSLLMVFGIFAGMREFMQKCDQKISLKMLMKEGCKIAGLNAVIMSIFLLIYYSYIDTGYFTVKIRQTLSLMAEKGISKEQMKEYYLNAKFLFFAPDKVASFALFGYLVTGCIYAVISGFLLRKNLVA